MNRREFIAAAAVASTGPILLGMSRKAEDKKPVIGVEGHKYECVHDWGTLPADYGWQTTHNVALDAAGNVYITHQGAKGTKMNMDTVLVFDPKGKFVRSFGKDWHEGGHGIEIRQEGREEFIYLSNTWTPNSKLVKTNLKGEFVWAKGRPECKEYDARTDPKDKTRVIWPAYSPTNICFTDDGGFFVGDGYGSNHMLKFDKDAKLVKVFGGTGLGPAQFRTPHGQWVDARRADEKPRLVVCDRANARLSSFTIDGGFINNSTADTVLFPAHAKTRGDVLMVPDLHARISLFGKQDKLIVHLGEDKEWREKVVGSLNKGPAIRNQPKEWPAGKFIHPHDAAFDKDGNIYVVEWVSTGRVTFLKKV